MSKKFNDWVLHPFLLGIYPALALLAYNIRQISPLFAVRSILFSLLLTVLTLVLFRLLLSDWRKAGLVTSLVMILFFTHGRIYGLVEDVSLLGINVGRHRFLAGLWIVLLFIWTWLVNKKIAITHWTYFANIMSVVLIVFPLFQIGIHQIQVGYANWQQDQQREFSSQIKLNMPEGQPLPDIYYIILDTYTRYDVMLNELDFDNQPFLTELEKQGLYVAICSQSTYDSTSFSLTSSLNMDYIGGISPALAGSNVQVTELTPYLQNNKVMNALRSAGYRIVAVETGYSPTDFTWADTYYATENDIRGALMIKGLNPYEAILMQTSAGLWLYDYSINWPKFKVFLDYPYIAHRNRMLYAMNKLEEIPADPGPKFVFVHILAPHSPFVFGPNGEELIRRTPFTLNFDFESLSWSEYWDGYTGEVQYLNKRFLEIIPQILEKSSTPPIIILQGDHGIPVLSAEGENHAILNAFYLPGNGAEQLYPSVSPVNSFRIILNSYFGAELPLLEDKACRFKNEDTSTCEIIPDPRPICIQP